MMKTERSASKCIACTNVWKRHQGIITQCFLPLELIFRKNQFIILTSSILAVVHRLGFVEWPTRCKQKADELSTLSNELISAYERHLKCDVPTIKKPKLAKLHFHPNVLERAADSRFPRYICEELGREIGLTAADKRIPTERTAKSRKSRRKEYFFVNVPNISMAQAKEFATLLETAFNIQTPSNNSTSITKESSGSSGGISAFGISTKMVIFRS